MQHTDTRIDGYCFVYRQVIPVSLLRESETTQMGRFSLD